MKKFFEIIKDILYDSVDYIIMIGIVGIVIFIIGWRLDLLFAKDALDMPPNDIVIEDNNGENKSNEDSNSDKDNSKNPSDENNGPKEDNNTNNNKDENKPKDTNNSGNMVKFNIPPGSLPSKIGNILAENGLVSSKEDFVIKAQELKLDTKLKSGDYEIKSNSSIEEILKILTK